MPLVPRFQLLGHNDPSSSNDRDMFTTPDGFRFMKGIHLNTFQSFYIHAFKTTSMNNTLLNRSDRFLIKHRIQQVLVHHMCTQIPAQLWQLQILIHRQFVHKVVHLKFIDEITIDTFISRGSSTSVASIISCSCCIDSKFMLVMQNYYF